MTGMWVKLAPPPGWPVAASSGARSARRADGAVTLTWSRLELLPERQAEWADAVIASDLPPGARLERVTRRLGETQRGWPVLLVEATVARDSLPPAHRLAALYAFLEHGGHALVHADDAGAFAAESPRLREILLGAEPDLDDLVVAVDRFYEPR